MLHKSQQYPSDLYQIQRVEWGLIICVSTGHPQRSRVVIVSSLIYAWRLLCGWRILKVPVDLGETWKNFRLWWKVSYPSYSVMIYDDRYSPSLYVWYEHDHGLDHFKTFSVRRIVGFFSAVKQPVPFTYRTGYTILFSLLEVLQIQPVC